MALHHGTAGLLCRRVLDATGAALPDDLQAAMRAYLESCAQRHRTAVAELLDLLDALSDAGITGLPRKGPALAARAYAEPALRPCLDLDILIRERDIDRTLAMLDTRGFASQYPSVRADQSGGLSPLQRPGLPHRTWPHDAGGAALGAGAARARGLPRSGALVQPRPASRA